MKPKIYIDGKEGTTGLQIYERLGGRDDIELLLIDEDKRKFLNAADIAFLCLPDAAAKEAVSLPQVPQCSRHCVSVPAGCGGTRGRFAHRERHDPRY